MAAGLLQLLPPARWLAAMLVLVSSALHYFARLPQPGWLTPLMLSLAVLLSAGWWAAWRMQAQVAGGSRYPSPVRAVVLLSRLGSGFVIASVLILWQVHHALGSRLPAALEGRDLEITGIVDGMAQRFDFGDRVRFSLSSCRLAAIAQAKAGAQDRPGPGRSDADGGGQGVCGRLSRVQLDWGPQREKDRRPRQAETGDGAADNAADDAADDEPAGAADDEMPDETWPQPGQYWQLTVRLRRPVAPANPGGFDLELRYLQQGVGALGRVYARQRLAALPDADRRLWPDVAVAFEALRARLRDRLEAVHAHRVDRPGADRAGRWPLIGVIAGLALGDQGAISASLWGLFSRTGVSHLMAISGMHVTMLALVAAWAASQVLRLMTRSRIPGLTRLLSGHPRQFLVLIIAVLVAFAYALLSGWGIPSQRTCWMLTAAAAMSLSGRGRGAFDIALMAAAMVIVMDPWAVSTAGFWLSFGAVAAILWCAQGRDSQQVLRMALLGIGSTRIPMALRDAMTSQWAATVGLAPFVVALFSTLSLIGPVANAVAIPWVSFLVTPLAIAAALLAPVSEPLCALLLQVNLWLIEQLIAILSLLDRLPAASVAIPRPPPWTLFAAIIGAVALTAPPGVPMRRAGVLCLLPMLFAPQQSPSGDELWVTVLDIGQGSSILVESAGKRLLFDAGIGSGIDRSAASRFLVPYLRSRGLETIDTLVISHLDIEHAGGAAAVLQALRPNRLVSSFDARLLQAQPEALARVAQLPCIAGERFALGAATVEVLHPATAARLRKAARDNAGSCVMRIASRAGSVLLMGDLPASMDPSLVRALGTGGAGGAGGSRDSRDSRDSRGAGGAAEPGRADAPADLRADVLIVPQQGSRNATSALLLAAVQPSFAVLQVGYRNRHRHPHPTVLQRLSATDALVLRTDHDGAVQIRLRPSGKPQVHRIRRDAPPYWRIDTAGDDTAG